MRWASAALRALLIIIYFGVLTVWLPSSVLRLQAVAGSPQVVVDLLAITVWGVFVGLGLWGLRQSQGRGWI